MMGDQPTPYGSPELEINPPEPGVSGTSVLGQHGYSRLLELGGLDIARRIMIVCRLCNALLEPSGPRVPLLLHCGHSVCLSCVREAVTSSSEKESTQVQCPADNQLSNVDSREDTFGLRRNLTLIEMLQKTFQHREKKPKKTRQQGRHPADTPRQDSQNGRDTRGLPGSDFFIPSEDFANPTGDIQSPQINCENVDSFVFEQNIWNNGSESAEIKEARDILQMFEKERAKARAQYMLQRRKLKTALESVRSEQGRQAAEIATLQTSLDDLNASFSEQIQSLNYRTNQFEQNAADHKPQRGDGDAVKDVVKTKARSGDFYLHSLHRLHEEIRGTDDDDNNSQLINRMSFIHSPPNPPTGTVETEASACWEIQFQEQKQMCDQLKLQYEEEKRQHRQTINRYELILSAKDNTIIAQEAERLMLIKRLDEQFQSEPIRQPLVEPKRKENIWANGRNLSLELEDPPSLRSPVEETPPAPTSSKPVDEREGNTSPVAISKPTASPEPAMLPRDREIETEGNGEIPNMKRQTVPESIQLHTTGSHTEVAGIPKRKAPNVACGTEIQTQEVSDGANERGASDPDVQRDGSDVEVNGRNEDTREEGSTENTQGTVSDQGARRESGDFGGHEEVFRDPILRPNSFEYGISRTNSNRSSSEFWTNFKLKSSISVKKKEHEDTVTGVAEIWGSVVVTLANQSSLSFYSHGSRNPQLKHRHFIRSLKSPSGMAVVQRSNTLVVSDRYRLVFIGVTEDLVDITDREIPLEINPVSVSVNQRDSTIIVCSGGGKVQILNEQGAFIGDVKVRKADWVSALQLKNQFVLLDRCKLSTKSNVVWFNKKGIEEICYRCNSFDEMNNPEHMVEMRGMMLVADTNNARIHLVDDSGTFVDYVLTSDEISWPDRLYCDESAGLLLVAQHDGLGSVKVLVFKEQRGILGSI